MELATQRPWETTMAPERETLLETLKDHLAQESKPVEPPPEPRWELATAMLWEPSRELAMATL